jgi:uncharacterized membrane protein
MTEVQALFLILAAIYLVQCIVWVPEDSVVLRRGLGRSWRFAPGGLFLAALKLRGVPVNPLPPLPGLIVCEPPKVFISPEGVAAPVQAAGGLLETATLEFFSFDQISAIRAEDKKLVLNSQPLCSFGSALRTRDFVALLSKVRSAGKSERPAIIASNWRAAFDAKAINERMAIYYERTALLRLACNLLFLLLFGLVPLTVWRRGLAGTWPFLLAGLMAYLVVISSEFIRAHKILYPTAGDERLTEAISVVLSPAGALRANDLLLKNLLVVFHPVAVARQLCSEPVFMAFASRALRELSFPLAFEGASQAEQARRWWFEQELRAVRIFLVKIGINPQELLAPPDREPGCHSFCPRCCSQYVPTVGVCKECGDIELCPFPENPIAVGCN